MENPPTAVRIFEKPASGALGDLLFSLGSKSHTSESQWVALVVQIASGDEQALRELYLRMHALVFTLIVRIVRDHQTAEELTMDVFHQIWKRAATYEPAGGTVVGWVMNQARSRAIDQTRFATRKKRVNPYPDTTELCEDSDSGDSLDSLGREVRLRAAVAKLTPKERNAIELAFFSECTYAE